MGSVNSSSPYLGTSLVSGSSAGSAGKFVSFSVREWSAVRFEKPQRKRRAIALIINHSGGTSWSLNTLSNKRKPTSATVM